MTFKMVIENQWKWRGDCGRQDGNSNGNQLNSSEFQDGNGNGNFGEILKNNKTAGSNFDLNGPLGRTKSSLSTVKPALPSNESYESKTGCNHTAATNLGFRIKTL